MRQTTIKCDGCDAQIYGDDPELLWVGTGNSGKYFDICSSCKTRVARVWDNGNLLRVLVDAINRADGWPEK